MPPRRRSPPEAVTDTRHSPQGIRGDIAMMTGGAPTASPTGVSPGAALHSGYPARTHGGRIASCTMPTWVTGSDRPNLTLTYAPHCTLSRRRRLTGAHQQWIPATRGTAGQCPTGCPCPPKAPAQPPQASYQHQPYAASPATLDTMGAFPRYAGPWYGETPQTAAPPPLVAPPTWGPSP